ncbi:MAG: magnesium transporter [Candidatus Caldatribacteriota bacterium]
MREKIKGLAEKIALRLEEKKFEEIKEYLEDLHPSEFAELAEYLTQEQVVELLKLLPDDESIALFLSELNLDLQSGIMSALGKEKASDILEEMDADDAADFLGEIAPQESRELLDLMPKEEAEEIEELLSYKENTAGSIMTSDFVALPENLTAEEAIKKIRELSPEAEMIYYVYIVDKRERLVGVISLRDLIVAKPNAKISEIMEDNVVSVLDTEDQETAAKIIADYDFLALPVVNNKGILVGMITVDDIIDVMENEVTEDIHKMVGSSSEVYEDKLIKASSFIRAKSRISWLFICMIGGIMAGSVIRIFSDTLQNMVTLAFFIPVIIDMGGNVGTQSATITVRALATGQLKLDELWQNIWAEARVGLLIGLITGVILAAVALIWQNNVVMGVAIGLSMCITIIVSAAMGTLLPLIFTKVGVDPAVSSGPLITTIIDVGGLSIYFSVSILLFKLFGNG